MQKGKNITQIHTTLLSHMNNLFSRQSLATNSYLFKQMKNTVQIPVYVIIQQRRILQITKNQELIVQTLQMCELVRLNRKLKTVQIIDFPTVRVQSKYAKKIGQAQAYITSKGIQVSTFGVYQGNGDFLFTVYKQHAWNLIQQGFKKLQQKIPSNKSLLFDQIKDGVAKFKRNKKQQLSMSQKDKTNNYSYQNSYYGYNGYNGGYNFSQLDKPQAFIRKAIQSDSQEQQVEKVTNQIKTIESVDNKDGQTQNKKVEPEQKFTNGKAHRNGKNGQDSKRKYKQPVKVIINDDDFPTLC